MESLKNRDGLQVQETIDPTKSLQFFHKLLIKLPFYLRKEENALNYEEMIYSQAEAWLNQELEFCSYIPEKVFSLKHLMIQELKVENIPKNAIAYLEIIPNGHLEKVYFLKKINPLGKNQQVH